MRISLQSLVLVWLGTAALALAQDASPLDWPCDVIPLGTDKETDRAPVVSDLSLQPKGQLLAMVGDDHLVRICDRQTGRILRKLQGHADWVRAVTFTPDGGGLITAGYDHAILLWDPLTGERLSELDRLDFAIASLAVDPTGTMLAVAGFSKKLVVIDLEEGTRRFELTQPCGDLRAVEFSADARWLAAGGRDGVVRVWDAESGVLTHELPLHRRRIRDLAFSADGSRLASCGEDQTLQLVDLNRPEEVLTIDSRGNKVFAIELLDDNLIASAGTDNLIRVWDLETLREVGQLIGHEGSVTSLAFDGSRLYSTGYDTFLRIWRVNANFASVPVEGTPRVSRDPSGIIE